MVEVGDDDGVSDEGCDNKHLLCHIDSPVAIFLTSFYILLVNQMV